MTVHRSTGWSVILLIGIVAVACSSPTEDTALGGDALPVQNPSESYVHPDTEIEGTITLEATGCWMIDIGDGKRLVVFPVGYLKDSGGSHMVSADRTVTVEDGDVVIADGGVAAAASFPGVPDGYWGNYLAFCRPPIDEFVVIDRFVSIDH